MKKIVNMFLLFILLFSIINVFYNISYAAPDGKIDALVGEASGAANLLDASGDPIFEGINKIIGLLQIVGTGISIIVVTMLGIKYIMASPGEKAETKKQIMPIIIGCVLVFGGVNVVAIIARFVTNSTGT